MKDGERGEGKASVWISREDGDGLNHFVDVWSKKPSLVKGKWTIDNFNDFYLGELAEITVDIGLKPGECAKFEIRRAQ
jgi:hypothetical protein